MAATFRLTVVTGPHKGEKFCFRGLTHCLLGRGDDCFIQLAGTIRDQFISRHHCQFNFDLPEVEVQDLGSQNGTFLNGKLVRTLKMKMSQLVEGSDRITHHSELLTVGGTTILLELVDCPPRGQDLGGCPVWEAGEIAKKNCTLACS